MSGTLSLSFLVARYTDLFKAKTYEVLWNPAQGALIARVYDSISGVLVDNLPVTDVPSHILKDRDVQKMEAYFRHTHLASETGVDGSINRVSTHIIAPAAGKGVIPFQPGLALGSVVKAETIDKIERFADQMAAKQNLEDRIRMAEQRLTAFELQRESRLAQKPELKKINKLQNGQEEVTYAKDVRLDAINSKIEKQKEKIEKLYDEKFADTEEEDLPTFNNFQASAASPVDMGRSTIESQPRAFDTLDFNSQYIKMSESEASIHNQVSQSSNSINVSANASYLLCSAGVKYGRVQAIASRVAQIKKRNTAQGTLIINATVTTRHVRCYTKLHYDHNKLRLILDAMNKGDEATLRRYGISVPAKKGGKEEKADVEAVEPKKKEEEKEPAFYVLTEAVMGAYFTSLITFLDESETGRDGKIKQDESIQTLNVNAELGLGKFATKASVGVTRSGASNKEDDELKSKAQTKVEIEISSEGVLPQFERNNIEREVISHVNLDPTKFVRTQEDDKDAEDIAKGGDDRTLAQEKRRIKMANAQEAILNTMRGLNFLRESQKIQTMESVLGAYESFLDKVTKDPNCGVPVGFNYDIITKSEIERILGIAPKISPAASVETPAASPAPAPVAANGDPK